MTNQYLPGGMKTDSGGLTRPLTGCFLDLGRHCTGGEFSIRQTSLLDDKQRIAHGGSPFAGVAVSLHDADDTYLAPLECRSDDNASMVALLMRCIKGNQFRRIAFGELIATARLSLLPLAG